MANLRGLPPALQRVQRQLIQDIDALSEDMEAGNITVDQWQAEMQRIVERGMNAAMMAGKRQAELTDIERTSATRLVNVQNEFLNNFASDVDINGWLPAYTSRAQMYATSTTAAYSMGDVIRQAGQMLPLPAMPTEGTICLSNCGCRWEITVIDADRGDFNAKWVLGKERNCQTCEQRRDDWSKVEIRDNLLQL